MKLRQSCRTGLSRHLFLSGLLLLCGIALGSAAHAQTSSNLLTSSVNFFQTNRGPSVDYISDIVDTGNGKVLAIGGIPVEDADGNDDLEHIGVVRYDIATRTPDPTFSGDGKASFLVPNTDVGGFGGTAAAVSGGSIVVAATIAREQGSEFALLKLTQAGNIDTAFSPNGFRYYGLGVTGFNAQVGDLAIDELGRYVIAGSRIQYRTHMPPLIEAVILRVNPDGTPDASFCPNGLRVVPLGGDAQFRRVIIWRGGKILLGTQFGTSGPAGLVRLLGDGRFDTSFNGTGVVRFAPELGLNGKYTELQGSSSIVVGGTRGAIRVLGNGVPDSAFGPNGVASHGHSLGLLKGMSLDSAGRLVLLYFDQDFSGGLNGAYAVRFTDQGVLDTSFGEQGVFKRTFYLSMLTGSMIRVGSRFFVGLNGSDFQLFITAFNLPPVIQSATTSYTIPAGESLQIPLLVTDPEGKALKYGLSYEDVHGSLSLEGNVVTYTPYRNFKGDISFVWSASDGLDSVQHRVNVRVTEARSLVVTTLGPSTFDDELTSLTEAIDYAHKFSTPQTVTFKAGLAGTCVVSSTIGVSRNVNLKGPGARVIAVQPAGNNQRLFAVSGTLAITGLTLQNSRSEDGGAVLVYPEGTLRMLNCALKNNQATGTATYNGLGGAIFSRGAVELHNCTLSGNKARLGGALYLTRSYNGPGTRLVNNTLSGNSASVSGAAIAATSIAGVTNSLTLVNTTIAGNTSPDSAVTTAYTVRTLINTIISANTGGNIRGSYTDGGGNYISLNPKLGPLQNNGGQVDTMALLPGSLAINKGTDSVLNAPYSLTTDARFANFPRKIGAKVDPGAYEAPLSAASVSADSNPSVREF